MILCEILFSATNMHAKKKSAALTKRCCGRIFILICVKCLRVSSNSLWSGVSFFVALIPC